MRSHPINTLLALLLVAGLAINSAAHRIQHGLEYARSVPMAQEASLAHPGDATVGKPVPPTVTDESICVLCQVVDAQVVLASTARDCLDPGRETASDATSAVHTTSVALTTGRSPPGRI